MPKILRTSNKESGEEEAPNRASRTKTETCKFQLIQEHFDSNISNAGNKRTASFSPEESP